jgi:hypothetical protein
MKKNICKKKKTFVKRKIYGYIEYYLKIIFGFKSGHLTSSHERTVYSFCLSHFHERHSTDLVHGGLFRLRW